MLNSDVQVLPKERHAQNGITMNYGLPKASNCAASTGLKIPSLQGRAGSSSTAGTKLEPARPPLRLGPFSRALGVVEGAQSLGTRDQFSQRLVELGHIPQAHRLGPFPTVLSPAARLGWTQTARNNCSEQFCPTATQPHQPIHAAEASAYFTIMGSCPVSSSSRPATSSSASTRPTAPGRPGLLGRLRRPATRSSSRTGTSRATSSLRWTRRTRSRAAPSPSSRPTTSPRASPPRNGRRASPRMRRASTTY